MTGIKKINENIYKINTPYKDIFTTVCTVKTPDGVLIFDAASYDEDVESYILPKHKTYFCHKKRSGRKKNLTCHLINNVYNPRNTKKYVLPGVLSI